MNKQAKSKQQAKNAGGRKGKHYGIGVYVDGKLGRGRSCVNPETGVESAIRAAVRTVFYQRGRKPSSAPPVYQVAAKVSGRVLFEIRVAPNRRVLYVESVKGHIGARGEEFGEPKARRIAVKGRG